MKECIRILCHNVLCNELKNSESKNTEKMKRVRIFIFICETHAQKIRYPSHY